MSTFVDSMRLVADRIRVIPDRLGDEVTRVTIRRENWDRPIQDGAVTTGPVDVVVTPTPEVEKLSAAAASFYGGGPLASAAGKPMINVYKIGPMTQRTTAGGGYRADDFLMTLTDGTIQRATVILNGPNQAGVDEVCVVCDHKAVGSIDFYVWVKTAAVVTP
jgi:hypothetical protein